MPQLYQTTIWQALLPDGWQARKLRFESATLFKPDGVGQIFVFVYPPECEGADAKSATHQNFVGNLRGTSSTSTYGGCLGRSWRLTCRGRTLVVRYSCALANAEIERAEVNEIVQSMAESDAQAA